MARLRDFVKDNGGKLGEIANLPIDFFDLNPDNLRFDTQELRDHVEALANDMLANGYDRTEPLVFRIVNGRPQVQEGNCRLTAARLANSRGASILTLPCLPEPEGLTDEQRLARMVLANSGKHHTSAEYAVVIAKYRSWGWDDKAIATRLQRSLPWLLQVMVLAGAPEPIKQAVSDGTLAAFEAVAMVRAEGEKAVDTLVKALEVADKQEGKKKGHITAATIREAREPGTGGRKPRSDSKARQTEPPGQVLIDRAPLASPVPTPQTPKPESPEDKILNTVLHQTASQAIAVRDRMFQLETTARKVIDAYETTGGDIFLEALDDLKELVGWIPQSTGEST